MTVTEYRLHRHSVSHTDVNSNVKVNVRRAKIILNITQKCILFCPHSLILHIFLTDLYSPCLTCTSTDISFFRIGFFSQRGLNTESPIEDNEVLSRAK